LVIHEKKEPFDKATAGVGTSRRPPTKKEKDGLFGGFFGSKKKTKRDSGGESPAGTRPQRYRSAASTGDSSHSPSSASTYYQQPEMTTPRNQSPSLSYMEHSRSIGMPQTEDFQPQPSSQPVSYESRAYPRKLLQRRMIPNTSNPKRGPSHAPHQHSSIAPRHHQPLSLSLELRHLWEPDLAMEVHTLTTLMLQLQREPRYEHQRVEEIAYEYRQKVYQ
jgi:hypothetical protein